VSYGGGEAFVTVDQNGLPVGSKKTPKRSASFKEVRRRGENPQTRRISSQKKVLGAYSKGGRKELKTVHRIERNDEEGEG